MQDWMLGADIKKNYTTGKNSFISHYGTFVYKYLSEINSADSYLHTTIIDNVYNEAYEEGMFEKPSTKFSFGTKFIIKLREYLLSHPDIHSLYKGSDILLEFLQSDLSGTKPNPQKGAQKYISLNNKTKRYVFAARYYYFLNAETIQRRLNLSPAKYNLIISGFHSFQTTDCDCCAGVNCIEPELLECINRELFPEYQAPTDVAAIYPASDYERAQIHSKKMIQMQINSRKWTLTHVLLPLWGIAAIVLLIMYFIN